MKDNFEHVAIIGVGMIGGSVGLALRGRWARQVTGVDANPSALARAVEVGAIDQAANSLAEGVRDADCVIMATPAAVIPALLEALVPCVRADALITDVGSVKGDIVATGARLFGARFVGGHPMAGAPQGGIEAARADLFFNAPWAIVNAPDSDTEDSAWMLRAIHLARCMGARCLLMDSARHDRLAALVSHLPHVLAFAYADMLDAQPDGAAARDMAGGSYRDLTRVAGADRAFWQAIFAANRPELLRALDAYEARLREIRKTLEDETH